MKKEQTEKLVVTAKTIKRECSILHLNGKVSILLTHKRMAALIGISEASLYRLFRNNRAKEPYSSTVKLLKIFTKEYEEAKEKGELQQFLQS